MVCAVAGLLADAADTVRSLIALHNPFTTRPRLGRHTNGRIA